MQFAGCVNVNIDLYLFSLSCGVFTCSKAFLRGLGGGCCLNPLSSGVLL